MDTLDKAFSSSDKLGTYKELAKQPLFFEGVGVKGREVANKFVAIVGLMFENINSPVDSEFLNETFPKRKTPGQIVNDVMETIHNCLSETDQLPVWPYAVTGGYKAADGRKVRTLGFIDFDTFNPSEHNGYNQNHDDRFYIRSIFLFLLGTRLLVEKGLGIKTMSVNPYALINTATRYMGTINSLPTFAEFNYARKAANRLVRLNSSVELTRKVIFRVK